MLPELGLGVAVLTNQESGEAFESIVYHVVDQYLRPPEPTGSPCSKASVGGRRLSTRPSEKAAQARDTASKPSLALSKYAGTYPDAWYGDIAIEAKAPASSCASHSTPSLVGDMEHWQHDTFIVRWRDRELRADAFVTFALNPDGSIDQAKNAGRLARHGFQL